MIDKNKNKMNDKAIVRACRAAAIAAKNGSWILKAKLFVAEIAALMIIHFGGLLLIYPLHLFS
jgi:hypothetical protein